MSRRGLVLALVVALGASMLLVSGCSRHKKPLVDPSATAVRPGDDKGAGSGTENIGESEENRRKRLGGDMAKEGPLVPIYFDYDRATVRPDQTARLESNGKYLKDNPGQKALIEGHCDERGTVEYNFALGERRAQAVLEFLVKRCGVNPENLSTISKGEEEPAVQGTGDEVWAQNRRDEFKLVN